MGSAAKENADYARQAKIMKREVQGSFQKSECPHGPDGGGAITGITRTSKQRVSHNSF